MRLKKNETKNGEKKNGPGGLAWASLRYNRDLYAKGAFSKGAVVDSFFGDIIKAVAFAVQMLVAYFLMVRSVW